MDYSDELEHDVGLLTDVGFMFDACLEKVTCRYDYGQDVSVLLTYAQEEPGALQSGHYVWPAAPALCEYLEKNREVIPSGNIVELGAGCGLTGLTIAQLRPDATIIFTDHDPGVLKIIEHNAQQQKRTQALCLTHSLRWGPDGLAEIQVLEALQHQHKKNGTDVDGTSSSFISQNNTELIVGSDVIYAREIVPLLFWTVDRLMTKQTTVNNCSEKTSQGRGVFLMCSSFAYDDETEAEIDRQCEKFGLDRRIIQCTLNTKGTRIQQFTRTAVN